MSYMQYIPIACDVVLVLFFISVIAIMAKRGFIRSVYKLIAMIITIAAVAVLTQPVSDILDESSAGAAVYRNINQALVRTEQEKLSGGENAVSEESDTVWNMPVYIKNSSQLRNIQNETASNAAHIISDMILRLITAIFLFILIRLIVMLLFNLIDIIFKLPILKSTNKIIGILAGIINALAAVYVVCAVISLNIGIFSGAKEVIEKTYLVKYFYDYNILMNFFI